MMKRRGGNMKEKTGGGRRNRSEEGRRGTILEARKARARGEEIRKHGEKEQGRNDEGNISQKRCL